MGKVEGDKYQVSDLYPVCHSRITGVITQFAFDIVGDEIRVDQQDM